MFRNHPFIFNLSHIIYKLITEFVSNNYTEIAMQYIKKHKRSGQGCVDPVFKLRPLIIRLFAWHSSIGFRNVQ
jgi:hypothetical protein